MGEAHPQHRLPLVAVGGTPLQRDAQHPVAQPHEERTGAVQDSHAEQWLTAPGGQHVKLFQVAAAEAAAPRGQCLQDRARLWKGQMKVALKAQKTPQGPSPGSSTSSHSEPRSGGRAHPCRCRAHGRACLGPAQGPPRGVRSAHCPGWHRAREDPREPATGSAIHSGISSQECVGVAPRFGDFASFQGSGKLFNGTPQNAG